LERLERLEERIWRDATVVQWAIFTFFGGVVNFVILHQVALYYPPVEIFWRTTIPNYQNLGILSGATLLFLIGYPIFASHYLPEKRFVSPIDMSLLGAVLNLYGHLNSPLVYFVDAIIGSMTLVLFGVLAEAIAKPLVGVGMMDTDKRTFRAINCPISKVAKIIGDFDLKDSLDLDKKRSRHNNKLIIYRNSDSRYRFFVVLAEDSESKDTLIHCEAYSIGRYVIGSSNVSKRRFDMNVSYLERVLLGEKKILLEPADCDSSFPFYSEVNRILREPTRSRFAALARLPKRTVAIFAGIIFLALAYYLSYVGKHLTNESFVTALLGIVALILGMLPFIKGPGETKEWTEE